MGAKEEVWNWLRPSKDDKQSRICIADGIASCTTFQIRTEADWKDVKARLNEEYVKVDDVDKALDMALSEQKKELKQRLFEVLKKERLEITNPKLVLRVVDKVFD